MPSDQLEHIRQRFDFTSWEGANRLGRDLSVRNLTVPKGLVAGLDSGRMRELDPGDGSRLLRASWSVPGHEAALLVMDIRECQSRRAAHEVVLELLANMQAPDVGRLGEEAPGDVAFGRDSTGVVFARGNVAISICNGGTEVVSVGDVARTLDHWIMEQGL